MPKEPQTLLLIARHLGRLIGVMMRSSSETVEILAQGLAADFHVVPIHLPEAPIFMAVAVPMWDGVTGLKPRLPAGRGMSLHHALITAAAEATELRASLAQNHAKEIAMLAVKNGQPMVSARDVTAGKTVLVPAQAVYLDFAALPDQIIAASADSTGCAAGFTQDDAIDRGLLECIERDAVAIWWYGALPRPEVPLDLIDPAQPRLCWWLQGRLRQTRLLDLTFDFGVPVVLAFSCLPDGGTIAIGSAARADWAGAALAAITEMLQTELAMDQAATVQDPELQDWITQATTHSLIQFQPLPAQSPTATQHLVTGQDVMARVAALGFDVLAIDLTLPNDPWPTVRVMVPGLCAMGGRIQPGRFEHITGKPFASLCIDTAQLFEPF